MFETDPRIQFPGDTGQETVRDADVYINSSSALWDVCTLSLLLMNNIYPGSLMWPRLLLHQMMDLFKNHLTSTSPLCLAIDLSGFSSHIQALMLQRNDWSGWGFHQDLRCLCKCVLTHFALYLFMPQFLCFDSLDWTLSWIISHLFY